MLRTVTRPWNWSPGLMLLIFSRYFPKLLFANSLRVGFYFHVLLSFKSLVLLLPPVIFGGRGKGEKKGCSNYECIWLDYEVSKLIKNGKPWQPQQYIPHISHLPNSVQSTFRKEKLSIKRRGEKAFTFSIAIFISQILNISVLMLAALVTLTLKNQQLIIRLNIESLLSTVLYSPEVSCAVFLGQIQLEVGSQGGKMWTLQFPWTCRLPRDVGSLEQSCLSLTLQITGKCAEISVLVHTLCTLSVV